MKQENGPEDKAQGRVNVEKEKIPIWDLQVSIFAQIQLRILLFF
jgi:hypothetical protein